jgi:hypothetical protein
VCVCVCVCVWQYPSHLQLYEVKNAATGTSSSKLELHASLLAPQTLSVVTIQTVNRAVMLWAIVAPLPEGTGTFTAPPLPWTQLSLLSNRARDKATGT